MGSLHHFLFPFRWKEEIRAEDFCARLEAAGWVSRGEDWGSYAERQYFYPKMYAALYQKGEPLVGEYVCPWKDVHYCIEKKGKRYALRISDEGIKVKIYNTGVAIFLLEGESETGENGPEPDFEAVKNINDYGGRLILPFCGEESGSGICADRLWLQSGEKVLAECDFVARNDQLCRSGRVTEEESSRCLLLEGLPGLKELGIRPALDDRMYVVCGTVDPQTTDEMVAWLREPEKEAPDREKSLYEFVFKDPSDDCSCNDREMRRRLLKEHVYPRWLDYGTIYGITAQSTVALMNSDFVMKDMRGLYTQMCCLALIQKASLMTLQGRCAQLARELGGDKPGSIDRMIRLRKDLSIFEGQMCFEEISSQEQPIEMYDMLRKSLLLPRELENVRAQMDGLNDIASAKLNIRLSWVGIVIAAISALLALIALFS